MSSKAPLINTKKALLYYCLPIAFICFLVSRFIAYGTTLRVVGDEFGYWDAAAYFTGLDWSEVASINNYYGYGYALFLAPILKLPILAQTRYLIAQILNIVLLCCIFLMISYVIKKLIQLPDELVSLLALALTLYPPNTTYTLYNLTETLILFLFWAVLTLLTTYVYKPADAAGSKNRPAPKLHHTQNHPASKLNRTQNHPAFELYAAIVLAVYSYTVHQRTVIVTAVCFVAVIFIIVIKESDIKSKITDIIVVCALMAVLLAICSHIKGDFQANYLFIKDNSDIVNDFGHEASKLGWIWSAKGMKKFFVSAFGKLFNLLSTSYLFFTLIVFDFFKDIAAIFKGLCLRNRSKQKSQIANDQVASEQVASAQMSSEETPDVRISNLQIIRLFICTCLLASLGMETFSLFNYEWRYDLLIYGRYTDLFMSAALLVMVLDIIELKKKIVIPCVISAILYAIACVLTLTHIPQLESYGNASIFSISLYDLLLFGKLHLPEINPLYLIIVKTIVGFVVICIAIILINRSSGSNTDTAGTSGSLGLSESSGASGTFESSGTSGSSGAFGKVLPLLCVCAFIIYFSGSFYYQQRWSRPDYNKDIMPDIKAANIIRESGYADKLNYLVGYYDMIKIDNIQFLLPDYTIKCHKDPAIIGELSGEAIVTSIDSVHVEELVNKGYKEFTRGTSAIVWIEE